MEGQLGGGDMLCSAVTLHAFHTRLHYCYNCTFVYTQFRTWYKMCMIKNNNNNKKKKSFSETDMLPPYDDTSFGF